MVTHSPAGARRNRAGGWLMTEIVIAMGVLAIAMIPLAFSFTREERLARSLYYKAVAMELVDGEMEMLKAGEWKSYPEGVHPYTMRGASLTNLPKGAFVLVRGKDRVRLEWTPAANGKGGSVAREVAIP